VLKSIAPVQGRRLPRSLHTLRFLPTGLIAMSSLYDVRVLVVDADAVLADCFAETLRTLGYSVRSVHASDAALPAAREFLPHAMICEVVLSGMNGIDLANRFARDHPECKVLLTSGRRTVAEMMENMPEGFLNFARKPLNLIDVIEFLASCGPDRETGTGPAGTLANSRYC
jgi:DNA-binding NtrC family response regulator